MRRTSQTMPLSTTMGVLGYTAFPPHQTSPSGAWPYQMRQIGPGTHGSRG
jgi:hypothetical protein